MININDHVVEIEGTKYIPYDIAVKALNNVYTSQVDSKIDNLQEKLVESIKNISNLKLDD
jgi:hypothetical protein